MAIRVTSDIGLQCPHCGHIQPIGKLLYVMAWWWGSEKRRVRCNACEKDFAVSMVITRRWESHYDGPSEDESE